MLLILNPIAGRRRRGLVEAVVRHVRAAGWTVDVVETAAAGRWIEDQQHCLGGDERHRTVTTDSQ